MFVECFELPWQYIELDPVLEFQQNCQNVNTAVLSLDVQQYGLI